MFAQTAEDRLRDVESRGYARGFSNKHTEPNTYQMAAEYAAWLKGWRAGQANRRARDIREQGFSAIMQADQIEKEGRDMVLCLVMSGGQLQAACTTRTIAQDLQSELGRHYVPCDIVRVAADELINSLEVLL